MSRKCEKKRRITAIWMACIVLIYFSLSACGLLSNSKTKTMRIENRLPFEILLTEYTNDYDRKIDDFTSPISLGSGKYVVLHSNDWFSSQIIKFSYDNSDYEMQIPYVHNMNSVKAYLIESDETEYGINAYVQTSMPSPIRITQL